MNAVVLGNSLKLQQVPEPKFGEDEALIRVRVAGICKTDLELVKGYMGFRGTPGHEFVGEVVDGADGSWAGKRVVGEINLGCKKCAWCFRGLERHCPTRRVLGILNKDGAMAEFVTAPYSNLREVPEHVPDEVAVFTEPLAAACEIAEQVHLQPGTTCLVIGDGKLGLLIAQTLRVWNCQVTLLGRHESKLSLAANRGVETTTDVGALAPKYDMVVEATGAKKSFPLAVSKTKPRGVLVLKSTYAGQADFNLAPIVIDEISLIGSRCGRFEPALDLLARGQIEVTPMIHAEYSLKDAVTAFEKARTPGVLKVLLRHE